MIDHPEDPASTPTLPARPARRAPKAAFFAAGLAAVIMLGGGALAMRSERSIDLTPLTPTPIGSLRDSGAIAAKGDVAEIFGNKFILQDQTGRTLIDTGPDGGTAATVTKGEAVQVQGRFDDGSLHARMLTHPDGKQVILGPVGGPHGPLDRAKERLGFWPAADVAGLTAAVQSAGYTDVRVTGRGPRHLEVVARGGDGKDHDLHIDFDGRIRTMDRL